jgi:peptidoglycan hydrolase-like protein with peptidoglycan-binding domain
MHRVSSVIRWIAVLLAGILVGVAATSYVVNRPTDVPNGSPGPDTVRVEEGTLGRTLRRPAAATWDVAGTFQAPAGGIITEVVATSGLLAPGSVLLRINERPVVLIPGDVPAFRDLEVGSSGRDVSALQLYLASLGYDVDATSTRFSTVTAAAVGRWQKTLGIGQTGVVALGDVVFASGSALQAPLRWMDPVFVGATLAAGAPILERLAPRPTLTIEFGGSPPTQLEPGVTGDVKFPNGAHRSVVLGPIQSDLGRVWASLDPAGDDLCLGADCLDLVPAAGVTPLDVTFTLVPETTGPLVPVAALQSDATGGVFVVLADGSRRTVTVRVASGGSAIVDGIAVGEEILLP